MMVVEDHSQEPCLDGMEEWNKGVKLTRKSDELSSSLLAGHQR